MADEPRAIIQHFAAAMEAKLVANEHKPGWKQDNASALFARLNDEIWELNQALVAWRQMARTNQTVSAGWANDVLEEAADCGNFLMMICDVVGTLPPTDEHGRE